jgi:hypothetical protein
MVLTSAKSNGFLRIVHQQHMSISEFLRIRLLRLEYPEFRPSVTGHAIGKINDPNVTSTETLEGRWLAR